MWLAMVSWLSSRTSRSLTISENCAVAFVRVKLWTVALLSCWRVPGQIIASFLRLISVDFWQFSHWCKQYCTSYESLNHVDVIWGCSTGVDLRVVGVWVRSETTFGDNVEKLGGVQQEQYGPPRNTKQQYNPGREVTSVKHLLCTTSQKRLDPFECTFTYTKFGMQSTQKNTMVYAIIRCTRSMHSDRVLWRVTCWSAMAAQMSRQHSKQCRFCKYYIEKTAYSLYYVV